MSRPLVLGFALPRVAVAILIVSLAQMANAGGLEKAIHVFPGKFKGGKQPIAGLVFDSAGNLYGTTSAGGPANAGVVFELSPLGGGWVYTQIYAFRGAPDGNQPNSSLVIDKDGNLYGTTQSGGTFQDTGTVYELSPSSGGAWTEKVIQSSGPLSWTYPSSVVLHDNGDLFGTSNENVFELTPNGDGTWTDTVLYSFTPGGFGEGPIGPLVFDASGDIYGTLPTAGAFGRGSVFELSPSQEGGWTESTLYSFLQNLEDGSFPSSGVTFDSAGNLFGATSGGGVGHASRGAGTIYELSPSSGAWNESIIHRFVLHAGDGATPIGSLVIDSSGNIYGATVRGGGASQIFGTVFRLANKSAGWVEDGRYSFTGGLDGGQPRGGVILDPAGNIYGPTTLGGDGFGVVFELRP